MAANWEEADARVVKMVQDCVREHHPHLLDAKIGVLMRDEDGASGGRAVIGHARKVSDRDKVLLGLDFMLWFSKETWGRFTQEQRKALVDHELCHCQGSPWDGWKIVSHDFEEFTAVIHRHGLWLPDTKRAAKAIQPHLFELDGGQMQLEYKGEVRTFSGETLEKAASGL